MSHKTLTLKLSGTPAVAVLLAFALRAAILTRESLWRDEVDAVRFAFEPLQSMIGQFTITGFNGPLYHVLLRYWLGAAGVSDFTLRYFSLFFGVVLVALVFVVGRRMFGRRAAEVSALLAAVSPVLTWYAAEGKMYSIQPAVLAFAIYALLNATTANNRNGLWWALAVVSVAASAAFHILSPVFLAVAAVVVLASGRVRLHLRGVLISMAVLVLPALPVLPQLLGRVAQGGDSGHTAYSLPIIAQSLAFNWSIGLDGRAPAILPETPAWLIDVLRWLCLAAFVGAAFAGVGPARARYAPLMCLAWIALPTLIIWLVSQRYAVFQPRYVLWSAPGLYVLAGAGLARMGTMRVPAIAGMLLIGLLGFAGQVVNPIRPDLRGAVGLVRENWGDGDGVVFQISYAKHGFDYYTRGAQRPKLTLLDGPYTNDGMSDGEVGQALAGVTQQSRRIWLYETESEMWDERGMTRGWLDANWRLIDRRELRGVTVSRYEP